MVPTLLCLFALLAMTGGTLYQKRHVPVFDLPAGQAIQAIAGSVGVSADARKADNVLYNMLGGVGQMGMNLFDIGRSDRSISRMLDSAGGLTRQPALWDDRDVNLRGLSSWTLSRLRR